MKHLIRARFELAALAGISLVNSAFAVVNIAYVPVGNAGNANDSTGYGAVAYDYQIAKNETTIGQFAEFLNAAAKSDPYALYSTNMASDAKIAGISRSGSPGSFSYSVIGSSANKPITYVSWFDAARFCNWLHNGQGTGSTETGAYTLNGAMSGIYTVNRGVQTWIPSENEWYKAAYYDATKGGSGGYWLYPTQSDLLGGNTIGVPNSANYNDGDFVGSGNASAPISDVLTDVGAYGANADSFYGTNDQGGNVLEWNDAVSGSSRGLRGSGWSFSALGLSSGIYANPGPPAIEHPAIGFRVATVPEPSGVVLTLLASGLWVTRRKRWCRPLNRGGGLQPPCLIETR